MSSGGSGDLQTSRVSPADFRMSSMQDEMMMRQQQQVRQYYLHGPFLLLINLIHIVPV